MHTDDLSSDDEDFEWKRNRIGRVPLHWYDEYDHVGYDASGTKVAKSKNRGDLLDAAIEGMDRAEKGAMVVYDALNDQEVELTQRQYPREDRSGRGILPPSFPSSCKTPPNPCPNYSGTLIHPITASWLPLDPTSSSFPLGRKTLTTPS